MAKAKNKVIAGDYTGLNVSTSLGFTSLSSWNQHINLDAASVSACDFVSSSQSTSGTSAVSRGLVGAALLGPVGMLAAASAKKKGIHTVGILFSDGKKSILEVDDKIFNSLWTTFA